MMIWGCTSQVILKVELSGRNQLKAAPFVICCPVPWYRVTILPIVIIAYVVKKEKSNIRKVYVFEILDQLIYVNLFSH